MPYQRYGGGFGILPCGRSECGNAKSTIEPRYLISRPVDEQQNVDLDATLKFITYGFSSWIDIADTKVEISEDNGGSWALAFDGSNFQAPYDGGYSKIRRDGHSLIFYIQKTDYWPVDETVIIRFIGHDEFGQAATKEAPVVW
jgi:hypothetical protein